MQKNITSGKDGKLEQRFHQKVRINVTFRKMAAMREILHNLSLGHLIPNFERKKITADVVNKLSLFQLKELMDYKTEVK